MGAKGKCVRMFLPSFLGPSLEGFCKTGEGFT